MDSRSKILRGQSPNASHLAALQAADNNLRMVRLSHLHDTPIRRDIILEAYHTHTILQELLAITDAHVDYTLRSADMQQGKWLAEDPSLTQIQQMLMSR